MDKIPPEQLAILAKEDQSSLTSSLVITFTVISFVCVCLRLFTRVKYQAMGWEDPIIMLSMLLCIATAVFQVLQANAGNGRHAIFIRFPDEVENNLKYLFWSVIFYNASLIVTKISILLQYKRVFAVKEMRIPLHVLMGICVAWGITTLFTSILTCVPVHAYWNIMEKVNAKCIDNKIIWYVNASVNITTDLLVVALPFRVIWGLHIPKRQKVALLGVLTIGWFVCVVSILRLHALVVLMAHPEDKSWYGSKVAYWSSIEINLAIVCACLPTLKPLLVKIIPDFTCHYGSRTNGSTGLIRRLRIHGLGNSVTRNSVDVDLELASNLLSSKALSSKAHPSTSNESVYGENICIPHNSGEHVEEHGRRSYSASHKAVVTLPQPVFVRP
ncbi:uncharacterized protein K460DRAFT_429649 [Cucurbitaria berberidis CBS 394.84]|uniref:Rhodopsin domain-containing protein n=1 Tax=Cucurbitaria berberidis CBS 394.84 TaxID=1168544 RepID=A0A9P4GF21_9PLEO|nr:uncharacterized protein K460DRAFT_429649 [Cucurbitaria berberidis CBS 394.84]KAF1844858.1 hypothetical protein K460DRAFT_429649 [Cucurbitaria berberidis CBS 394.84]